MLDIVTRESQRLNSIITDFLAYSRGKQYRFDQVDMVPLLEDTLTLWNSMAAEVQKHRDRNRAQICRAASAGPCRRRSHQAGLLELLRECGSRHEAGRHADDRY